MLAWTFKMPKTREEWFAVILLIGAMVVIGGDLVWTLPMGPLVAMLH